MSKLNGYIISFLRTIFLLITVLHECNAQDAEYNLNPTTYEVLESAGSVDITVCKDDGNPMGAKLLLTFTDGTATSTGGGAGDIDYIKSNCTITLKMDEEINGISGVPGRCRDETVTIMDDTESEGDEIFNVILSNLPNCATDGDCELLGDTMATVRILDDDIQNVGCDCTDTWFILARPFIDVAEPTTGTTQLMVPVLRKGDVDDAGSVDLQITGLTATSADDYTSAMMVTVNFNADDTVAFASIDINADDFVEGDEDILISLINPVDDSQLPADVFLGDLTYGVITIYDADVIDSRYYLECSEYYVLEDTTLTLTVKREGDLSGTGTITLLTSDVSEWDAATGGTDYTEFPSTGSLVQAVFASGDLSMDVMLATTPDTLVEGTERLLVDIIVASGAGAGLGEVSKATVYILDAEAIRTRYYLDCSEYYVLEDNMLTLTVKREGDLTESGTITLLTSDVSEWDAATGGTDYTEFPSTGSLVQAVFASGDSSMDVMLATTPDTLVEGTERLLVDIIVDSGPGAGLGEISKATVYILDAEGIRTRYYLDCSEYYVLEDNMLTLTVKREGDLTESGTITLLTSDVSEWDAATGGTDYTEFPSTGSLVQAVFASSDSSMDVMLATTPDTLVEGTERLLVDIIVASGAGAGLGEVSKATVYILDAEAIRTRYYLDCSEYYVLEDNTLTLTVKREGDLTESGTITLLTSDVSEWDAATGGTDYTEFPSTGSLVQAVFASGDSSMDVMLTTTPDTLVEGTERLLVDIIVASGPGAGLGEITKATVYILDAEAIRTWYYLDCSEYYVLEDNMLTLTVKREGDLSEAGTITLLTSDVSEWETATGGTDYTEFPSTGSLVQAVFASGDSSMNVMLATTPDTLVEGTERLLVNIIVASGAGAGLGEVSKATVYILDAEAIRTRYYLDCSEYYVLEDNMLTLTVKREGDLTESGTVTLLTSGVSEWDAATSGTDYTEFPSTGSLVQAVFGSGDSSMDVMLATTPDTLVEGTERLLVNIIVASGAGAGLGEVSKASVYILDAEGRWFYLDCPEYYINEGDTDGTVTVNLKVHRRGDLSGTQVITFSADEQSATDPEDYGNFNPANGQVTFTGTDTEQTITIAIVSDTVYEETEQFQVKIAVTPGDGSLGDLSKATVTINDDDPAPTGTTAGRWFYLDCPEYYVNEGDTDGAVTVTLKVYRRGDFSGTQVITFSADEQSATNPEDYGNFNPANGQVTFTGSDTEKTITIAIVSDTVYEETEQFQVKIAVTSGDGSLGDLSKATVTINDDDPVPTGPTTDCDICSAVCTGGCSNGGVCVGNDLCVCPPGYSGNLCQYSEPATIFYLDSPEYFVTEDGGSVTLRIHRDGDLSGTPTVTVIAIPQTAVLTEDYEAIASGGSVTFADSASFADAILPIRNDALGENQEQLEVRIAVSGSGNALGELYRATVTIDDDDITTSAGGGGTFTFFAMQEGVYYVKESQTAVIVGVARAGDLTASGTVGITTIAGTAKAGTHYIHVDDDLVEFGISNFLKQVTIDLPGNLDVDRDRHFKVCLSDPVGGQVGPAQCASIVIVDDESVYGFRQPMYFASAADSFVVAEVVRTGNTDDSGRVEVSTRDGTAVSGMNYISLQDYPVVFAEGNNVNPVRIDLSSINAYQDQNLLQFMVCLQNPTGGVLSPMNCATIVVEGQESSSSVVSFAQDTYSVREGDAMLNVTVNRRGNVGGEARVGIFTSDVTAIAGLDYTASDRTLIFDEGQTSATFQLFIHDLDSVREGIETLRLEMRDLVGTLRGEIDEVIVFIEDDDAEHRFASEAYTVEENDGQVSLIILKQGYLGETTTIFFSTSIGSAISGEDYIGVSNEPVIFGPNESSKTVRVNITDDSVGELSQHFGVHIEPTETCTVCRANIAIFDDDDIDVNECELEPSVCPDGLTCMNLIGSIAEPGGFECVCSPPAVLIDQGPVDICRADVRQIPGNFAFIEYNSADADLVAGCLTDRSNTEFRYWADILEPELIQLYRAIPGFITCIVRQICPSSIYVDYVVVTELWSTLDRETVMDVFYDNVDTDNFLGESTLKLLPSSVPCPDSHCLNGGTCYGNSTVFNCRCPSGYTGDRCDERIDKEASGSTMAIVWGLVAFDILLMLLFLGISMCGIYMCKRVSQVHQYDPGPLVVPRNDTVRFGKPARTFSPDWSSVRDTGETSSSIIPSYPSLKFMAKEDVDGSIREAVRAQYKPQDTDFN